MDWMEFVLTVVGACVWPAVVVYAMYVIKKSL